MAETKPTSHIVVTSIPLFSHESSVIEFCKRLIQVHNHFQITCIFPTIDAPIPATLKLLESLPSTIHCTFLPPIKKQDLPQEVTMQLELGVTKSMPSFRESLSLLCSTSTTPVVAIVVDPFANQALEIAKEFNILSFMYFPVSAMTTSLHLHLPILDEQVSGEYMDHVEPIEIPGCTPIRGQDLPRTFFEDRSSIAYETILRQTKRFSLADGVLINSFSEMEESTVRALMEKEQSNNKQLVYLVGPIIQTGSNELNKSVCVKWLENQRPKSVLYVSFGSRGSLSQEQINELALGLELSGQKFLWVLREPNNSEILGDHSAKNDPLKYLPSGFLGRTKEQGLVVSFWAPQTQILSHTSTGGFLTHCGWNSTLESIASGVPMITWPLFGEQRLNAILLIEGLKVGLKVKFNESGIAEREEIAKVIRDLMLGEERSEIEQRIEELKYASTCALAEDGSSTRVLSQLAIRMESNAK
ncbi:putative hydroquinone glucosyltransferase [Medicago truncatula]|uniref:Glycosyltransferase n=1 Tax=Medicago truncatula TaxID=3880 RepID=A0A396GPP2_MEDTR|nr:hydroquinone glucosyltransferase [Medicago truncatula]RHN42111.1 putative hydroquinone glucosyltransferase [Medicago truncatula]